MTGTPALDFCKLEGLGNDFILLDERDHTADAPQTTLEKRIAWCRRGHDVGADGVLTLLPPLTDGAVCTMHVTNADGSVPEMCGNGLRCVFRWLADQGVVAGNSWATVDTGAGPLQGRVLGDVIEVEMGDATLADAEAAVDVDGVAFRGLDVATGNPHFVLDGSIVDLTDGPVDDDNMTLAQTHGSALEHHAHFPHRANIEFSRVDVENHAIDLVVWERGCGITQACGTGACATAAAWVHRGALPENEVLQVHLPGGDLGITVGPARSERDGHVVRAIRMSGPARQVYLGQGLQ